MYILIAIVGLVASASAKDLIVGQEGGVLIFNQNVTASPTVWRQARNLTVTASDKEVINRVVVIDTREDKNGEATIVEGGVGHKNVTIELKSPAVFRGFYFDIQVYAKPEAEGQAPIDNEPQNSKNNFDRDTFVNNKDLPEGETDDVINGQVTSGPTASSTEQVANGQEVQSPKEDNLTPLPTVNVNEQVPTGQEVQHPVDVAKDVNQETQQSGVDTQQVDKKVVFSTPIELKNEGEEYFLPNVHDPNSKRILVENGQGDLQVKPVKQ